MITTLAILHQMVVNSGKLASQTGHMAITKAPKQIQCPNLKTLAPGQLSNVPTRLNFRHFLSTHRRIVLSSSKAQISWLQSYVKRIAFDPFEKYNLAMDTLCTARMSHNFKTQYGLATRTLLEDTYKVRSQLHEEIERGFVSYMSCTHHIGLLFHGETLSKIWTAAIQCLFEAHAFLVGLSDFCQCSVYSRPGRTYKKAFTLVSKTLFLTAIGRLTNATHRNS